MKTLSDSDYFYKLSNELGDPSLVAVHLDGVNEVTIHSKKNTLTTRPGVSKSREEYSLDKYATKMKDLKKGDEEMIIKGWITDKKNETAWNQLWKLRAMVTSGGPLNYFEMDNILFKKTDTSDLKEDVFAWLVDVSGTFVSDDTGSIHYNNLGEQIGRIEISLKIVLAREQ